MEIIGTYFGSAPPKGLMNAGVIRFQYVFPPPRGAAQRQRGAGQAAPEPRQELGGAQRGAPRREALG